MFKLRDPFAKYRGGIFAKCKQGLVSPPFKVPTTYEDLVMSTHLRRKKKIKGGWTTVKKCVIR